jgi:hypothetical protein
VVPNCGTISSTSAQVNIPYSANVGATGGTGDYTFSNAAGLPAGLSMDEFGNIAGIPTTAGTYTFTFSVTSGGVTVTGSCTIIVNSPPPVLTAACVADTQGFVGVPYSASIVASGGTLPYTFTVSSGSLPTGLSLDKTSGLISGKPQTAGPFTFAVQVTDSSPKPGQTVNTGNCGITISSQPPSGLAKGDTATIGFWHNKNGQALILSLNGGATSQALGNWLASSFPNLYGSASSNNLSGKTNAYIANYFLQLFGVSGQKTYAQMLAGALAAYSTSSSLAGGTYAAGYGFTVSAAGTGAKVYNTGSNGTAIGLLNNTNYTILQLLNQANAVMPLSTSEFNALNNIFSGINQTGDIS